MHYIPNSVEYEEETLDNISDDSPSRDGSSIIKRTGGSKKLKHLVNSVVKPFGKTPRTNHRASSTSPTSYGATDTGMTPLPVTNNNMATTTTNGRLPSNSTVPLNGSNPTVNSTLDSEKPTVSFEIPMGNSSSPKDKEDGSDWASTMDDEASRQQWRQEEIEKLKSWASFSVTHCILAILAYVAISVLLFSFFFEHWTILNSAYFAVVTFTTIGYGDLVPDSAESRIFTCIWALSGVASLGIALGVLGSNLIEVHEQEKGQMKSGLRNQVTDMFAETQKVQKNRKRSLPRYKSGNFVFSTLEEGRRRGMYDHIEDDHEPNHYSTNTWHFRSNQPGCWTKLTSRKSLRTIFLLALFGVLLYYIMQSEDWTIYSTLYYALITASTVGYGDLAPKTERGRLLAIIFIPFAVGVMGTILETVASTIIEGRRKRFREYLRTKPLTVQDIALLDVDGDGNVSRAEFLEFMLVTLDQVDKDLLDQLNEHFDSLDHDGNGTINKDDVASMARRNAESNTGG